MTLITEFAPSVTNAVPVVHPGGKKKSRNRVLTDPLVIIGALVFVAWGVIAVSWPWWAGDPYFAVRQNAMQPPSGEHWFGTDSLGRDVFARTMAGASTVMLIAPAATALTMVFGVTIGAISGYLGGRIDDVVMRIMDFILAFPGLIIAIIVLALFESDMPTLILLLAIFFTPLSARAVRGAVHSIRNAEFVDAARMRGDGVFRIIFTEVLPNTIPTIAVETTARLTSAIVTSASLSFLGLGITPPTADWGLMISSEASFITVSWWSSLAPAIALTSLAMAVALVAEGIRRGLDR